MVKERIFSIFGAVLAVVACGLTILSGPVNVTADPPAGNSPSGNSPEGNPPQSGGVPTRTHTPTPTATPTPTPTNWFPTRAPDDCTGDDQDEVFIFSLFHSHRHSNIFHQYVDQVEWDDGKGGGKKTILAYKPNNYFEPGSKVAGAAGTNRTLYQPVAKGPPAVLKALDDFFRDSITKRYTEQRLDKQYKDPLEDLLDDKVMTDWWDHVCKHAPGAFKEYYMPGRVALCPNWVQARSRELLDIHGPNHSGNNFVENFPLDKNGIPLPFTLDELKAMGKKVCDGGMMFVMQSPVSLLLDGATNIDEDATIVSFPLNPAKRGEFFVWKASSSAPLVVYDPDHTGEITSASQLFGNWTFGGKQTASISLGGIAGPMVGPWRDGYEAMESLDANGDRELSGEELRPLGLWRDANRNGVSEKGEVTPLEGSEVTKLFFDVERTQQQGNDIYLSKGFERSHKGKVMQGKSVDWYSTSAPSKLTLLSKLNMIGTSSVPAAPEQSHAKASSNLKVPKEFLGGWKWSINGDSKDSFAGFIVIGGRTTGNPQGISFAVQTPPEETNPWPQMAALMQASTFEVEGKQDGSVEFVALTTDGGIVHNSVKLSPDKKKLLGTSKATTRLMSKPATLTFNWTAERVK